MNHPRKPPKEISKTCSVRLLEFGQVPIIETFTNSTKMSEMHIRNGPKLWESLEFIGSFRKPVSLKPRLMLQVPKKSTRKGLNKRNQVVTFPNLPLGDVLCTPSAQCWSTGKNCIDERLSKPNTVHSCRD